MPSIIRLFKGWKAKELNLILQSTKGKGNYNVVGFDFGHGESTAAMLVNQKAGYRVTKLLIDNAQHKRMHTSLYRHKSDPSMSKVGESADAVIKNFGTNFGDYYLYFKAHPDYADQLALSGDKAPVGKPFTHAEAMNTYVRMFFDQLSDPIIASGNEANAEAPSIVLIGRPASERWAEAEARYGEILGRGLCYLGELVEKVLVISESLAALALTVAERARQFQDEGIDLADTVVCIDMGSSTADITVISDGCVACERSIRLGGELVERNMLAYALRSVEKKTGRAPYLRYPEVVTLNQLRVAKEAFYGESGLEPTTSVCHFEVMDENGKKDFEMFEVDEAFMNAAMREMPARFTYDEGSENKSSWYDACRAFYTGVKKEIDRMRAEGKINAVRKVILTGGASNMTNVVQEAAEVVFGEGVVERSTEPSYTVSKGLVYIARYAAETERIILKMPAMVATIVEEAIGSSDGLNARIAGKLAEQVEEGDVLATLKDWVTNGTGQSLESVFVKIGKATSDKMEAGKYDKAIQSAIGEWRKSSINPAELQKQINAKLADAFGVAIENFEGVVLPDNVFKDVEKLVRGVRINVNQNNILLYACANWWNKIFKEAFMSKADHSTEWRNAKYLKAVSFKENTIEGICDNYKTQLVPLKLRDALCAAIGGRILAALDGAIEKAAMSVFFHQALKAQGNE